MVIIYLQYSQSMIKIELNCCKNRLLKFFETNLKSLQQCVKYSLDYSLLKRQLFQILANPVLSFFFWFGFLLFHVSWFGCYYYSAKIGNILNLSIWTSLSSFQDYINDNSEEIPTIFEVQKGPGMAGLRASFLVKKVLHLFRGGFYKQVFVVLTSLVNYFVTL